MAIINLQFNFARKEKKITELAFEQFEKIKFKARVAIIDDEEVPYVEKLLADGYNINKNVDIIEVDSFMRKKYNVLVLDIQGVGQHIAGKNEGWGVLSYLKTEYPHMVIIVLTGGDWSITKVKKMADLADQVIGKDMEYLDFKTMLDVAIKKAFSPKYHLDIEKANIAKEISNPETLNQLIGMVSKYGLDKHTTLRKVSKITNNVKVLNSIDNYLSIVSSIFRLLE